MAREAVPGVTSVLCVWVMLKLPRNPLDRAFVSEKVIESDLPLLVLVSSVDW